MRKIKKYAESIILAIQRKFRYNPGTLYLIIIAILLIILTLALLIQFFHKNEEDLLIIPDKIYTSKLSRNGPPETFGTIEFKEITTIAYTERPKEVTISKKSANTDATSEWITFNITAYCPCTKCCGQWGVSDPEKSKTATGVKPVQGRTIAADWSYYPAGTVIEFEGLGKYVVEDKGGGIKGNKIDMYFTDHQTALKFGRQQLKGRIIE